MPQFNGKQEGVPHAAVLNLRCPRNGKWTCHVDTAFITVTERFEHALGKTMKVASTSPDTGQDRWNFTDGDLRAPRKALVLYLRLIDALIPIYDFCIAR